MVIEVADATVKSDRQVKLPIYAAAEVPVVWIVNLPKRTVEVYSEPAEGSYRKVVQISRKQSLALSIPGINATFLKAEDLF